MEAFFISIYKHMEILKTERKIGNKNKRKRKKRNKYKRWRM